MNGLDGFERGLASQMDAATGGVGGHLGRDGVDSAIGRLRRRTRLRAVAGSMLAVALLAGVAALALSRSDAATPLQTAGVPGTDATPRSSSPDDGDTSPPCEPRAIDAVWLYVELNDAQIEVLMATARSDDEMALAPLTEEQIENLIFYLRSLEQRDDYLRSGAQLDDDLVAEPTGDRPHPEVRLWPISLEQTAVLREAGLALEGRQIAISGVPITFLADGSVEASPKAPRCDASAIEESAVQRRREQQPSDTSGDVPSSDAPSGDGTSTTVAPAMPTTEAPSDVTTMTPSETTTSVAGSVATTAPPASSTGP